MAFLRAAISGLVMCAVVGCEFPIEPESYSDDLISVHSILIGDATTAAVLITGFDSKSAEFYPVLDAKVHLHGPSGTLEMSRATSEEGVCIRAEFPRAAPELEAGCYRASIPTGIPPGSSWELEVVTASARRFSGRATVPLPLSVHEPSVGERIRFVSDVSPGGPLGVLLATIDLQWTSPPEIGRVQGVIAPGLPYRDDHAIENARCEVRQGPSPDDDLAPAPSHQLLIFALDCAGPSPGTPPIRWDSLAATVVLTAFDTVYARYARDVAQSDPSHPRAVRPEYAGAGLTGAAGVFAAATIRSVPIMFVPESTDVTASPFAGQSTLQR
jgi:hypothetical protein